MASPTKKYPASYLFTMITELLKELELPYQVTDVYSFGYLPMDSEETPFRGIYLDVFTRDAEDQKTGTERIIRWIEEDISYKDWGQPPTDYPVIG